MPENMRAAPTTQLVLLGDGTCSEGDTNVAHLIFGVVRHKSPCVGEIDEHITIGSICTKDDVGSILLKKEKTKEREREREKRETKEKRKKEEKEKKERDIFIKKKRRE
jgi:hypothetical protein